MPCGKTWYPRKPGTPRVCPTCKTTYWNTPKKKDLFEKRMAVYKGLTKFLANIIRTARVGLDQVGDMMQETRDYEFLFGSEVGDFIREVFERGMELRARTAVPHEERNFNREQELLNWFEMQLSEAKQVFRPYIDFREP